MSDEKKPTRTVPASLATKEKPAIAVSLALFKGVLNIPGDSAAEKVKCNPEKRGQHWTCDYIPALRHLEITFYPSDERQPAQRTYVHETNVTRWDPA
jgi:hypothetical protein